MSLGLLSFPNPRLQLENNIRILRPHCINLTQQQRLQIQQLCNERLPPRPPEPEPPLKVENNNELEAVMEIEEVVRVQEEEQQYKQLQPCQFTRHYRN
jgi:hypothetical protein